MEDLHFNDVIVAYPDHDVREISGSLLAGWARSCIRYHQVFAISAAFGIADKRWPVLPSILSLRSMKSRNALRRRDSLRPPRKVALTCRDGLSQSVSTRTSRFALISL